MVKKIQFLILLYLGLLFFMGADKDDYYSKVDRLLGGTVQVMAGANSLPIITGTVDEYRTVKQENRYYSAAIKLADREKNYAWKAYENSRKLTPTYSAKKINEIALSVAGRGENQEFLDQISGHKYKTEELRFKKQQFFKDFKKGEGAADTYIENIGAPANVVLGELFEIDLPETAKDKKRPAEQKRPEIYIEPLEKWQEDTLLGVLREDEFYSSVGRRWQIELEPLSGEYTIKHKKIITIPPKSKLKLGVKITDPTGKTIDSEKGLAGYLPFVSALPWPENEDNRLAIYIEKHSTEKTEMRNTALKKETKIRSLNQDLLELKKQEPLLVNYSIDNSVESVELIILNSHGEQLFVIKEAAPDPQNPLPFVWQNNNEKQHYIYFLKCTDKEKNNYVTKPQAVLIKTDRRTEKIVLNSQKIENNGSGNYYGFLEITSLNRENYGLEKLYAWLHGSATGQENPASSTLYFSFSKFSPENSQIKSEGSNSTLINERKKIIITLRDQYNEPIANAPVTLYSRRNYKKNIDQFINNGRRTNGNGEAEIYFKSDIVGEAEIFAMSDLTWINQKPYIINVKTSLEFDF